MKKCKKIVVFGGTGFVGKYLINRLVNSDYYVNVVSQHPENADHEIVSGPAGKLAFSYGNIRDEDSIKKAVKGADIVINLVGVLTSKRKAGFMAIHAQGSESLAKISKKAGVKRFIQMSALGIDKPSGSIYARSKLKAEEAVKDVYPNATIFRPSVIFGPEDGFINLFDTLATFSPILPLIGGGKTKFQPVYVDDVAKAIVKSVDKAESFGKTYHLGGPKQYSFKEIVEFILQCKNRKRFLLPIPFFLSSIQAFFMEFMPSPLLTRDQVKLLKVDNIVDKKSYGFKQLGIKPCGMEGIVRKYLGGEKI